MTRDALGNEMILGQKYGYTINSNGYIQVIKGIADSIGEKKVTLREVEEATGCYGEPTEFKSITRKRSAYACNMFPIYENVH